jgi:hypothetical protein
MPGGGGGGYGRGGGGGGYGHGHEFRGRDQRGNHDQRDWAGRSSNYDYRSREQGNDRRDDDEYDPHETSRGKTMRSVVSVNRDDDRDTQQGESQGARNNKPDDDADEGAGKKKRDLPDWMKQELEKRLKKELQVKSRTP